MTIKNTGDCIWGLEAEYRKEPFTSELLVGIQLSFRLGKNHYCVMASRCPALYVHKWVSVHITQTTRTIGATVIGSLLAASVERAGTWMSMENELLSPCSLRSPLRHICVRKLRRNSICGSSLLEIDGRLYRSSTDDLTPANKHVQEKKKIITGSFNMWKHELKKKILSVIEKSTIKSKCWLEVIGTEPNKYYQAWPLMATIASFKNTGKSCSFIKPLNNLFELNPF